MAVQGSAEIRGIPGNWRWRNTDADGRETASRAGFSSIGSAVDELVRLFGDDYPIDVVRLDEKGHEVSRYRYQAESRTP